MFLKKIILFLFFYLLQINLFFVFFYIFSCIGIKNNFLKVKKYYFNIFFKKYFKK